MDEKKEGKKYLIISIIGVVLVVCVIIASIIIYKTIKKHNEELDKEEQYVSILEDGTKENTSPKIRKDRKWEKLSITNIELTEKAGITKLTGIIANNSREVTPECTATITLVDKEGNELTKLKIYVKELQPSESTRLNASATLDYVDAYDFKIQKD